MAWSNTFTTDSKGNPVVISTGEGDGTTRFDLPPMNDQQRAEYFSKIAHSANLADIVAAAIADEDGASPFTP